MSKFLSDILHISDLHFRSDIHYTLVERFWEHVLTDYGNEEHKPIILITGDLVQDGLPDQFKEAKAMLSILQQKGFTVIAVPGNRDYGNSNQHLNHERESLFNEVFLGLHTGAYPRRLDVGMISFLILNSMQGEEEKNLDALDGELGQEQLDHLERMIDQIRLEHCDRRIAICLHHPPFLHPQKFPLNMVQKLLGHQLKDGARLMEMIRGRVDYLLFGHDHDHVNFAESYADRILTREYRIPVILACGSHLEVNRMPAWLICDDHVASYF